MQNNDINKLLEMQDEKNDVNESVFVELENEFEEDLEIMRNTLKSHSLSSASKLEHFNIIIFGPTGAGKSSFIRTVFSAYHDEFLEPKEISEELIVKDRKSNEGTTKYSIFTLVDFDRIVLKIGDREDERKTAGIRLFDTRGQIYLDNKEEAHIDLMLQVISYIFFI